MSTIRRMSKPTPTNTNTKEQVEAVASDPAQCEQCPLQNQCTQAKNHRKVVTRHVWEDSKEWMKNNRLSRSGKQLYRKRKETIETKLRGCQRAPRVSLLPFGRVAQRQGASPDDSSRVEHEEEGDPPESPRKTGVIPQFFASLICVTKKEKPESLKRPGFSTL